MSKEIVPAAPAVVPPVVTPAAPPAAPTPSAASRVAASIAKLNATPAVEPVVVPPVVVPPVVVPPVVTPTAPVKTEDKKPDHLVKPGSKKVEAPAPVVAPVEPTDEAIKQEVETKMKGQPPEVKQAFSQARYAERALQRELNEAKPKLARVTELETQLAEAKTALDAAKTAAPVGDPADIATLKKENEEFKARETAREEELLAVKVEATAEFKKNVTTPREKVKSLVALLAKKSNQSSDKLMTALTDTSDEHGDLMSAAMEDMNQYDKTRFTALVGEITSVNEAETTLRANSKETLAKIAARSTTMTDAQKAEAKTARETAHKTNWQALQTELPEVVKTFEGDGEDIVAWNGAVKEAETFARDTDITALEPAKASEVMARAGVYPLLVGSLKSVEAELAALKTEREADLVELTKFRDAKPGLQATREPGITEDPALANMTGAQRAAAKIAKVTGAR